MSRIGKKPIAIPKGVTVKADADSVEVKGPKGAMKQALPPGITAAVEDGNIVTKKSSDAQELAKFHGATRYAPAPNIRALHHKQTVFTIENQDRRANHENGTMPDILTELEDVVHYEISTVSFFLNDSTAANVALVTPTNCS